MAAGLPKAVAAAEKLPADQLAGRRSSRSWPMSTHANIESFCDGVDVIVDGTDNFETRFLLNDAAVKRGIPWVYGGCIGAEGQTMTILPGETPCLRCLMHDCPPPGTTPTCDTAGILGPIVGVIASIQACEAIKILSGNREADQPRADRGRSLGQPHPADRPGVAPRQRRLPDLQAARVPLARRPRGSRIGRALRPQRRAVEPPGPRAASRWTLWPGNSQASARVTRNPFLLRLEVEQVSRSPSSPTAGPSSAAPDDIAAARNALREVHRTLRGSAECGSRNAE